jgi:hypothetical protein
MLARSDVFIGSAYSKTLQHLSGMTSTFSMLIASLRATNGKSLAVKVRKQSVNTYVFYPATLSHPLFFWCALFFNFYYVFNFQFVPIA